MFIQQLYTGCLSEAAYYIESNGEAAVVDPLRDIDEYLQIANERKTSIKYIFETHFHADFVSGHIDLAKATGATIVYGPHTVTKFPIHIANDGDFFKIGDLTIKVLHTPGHTLESTCYLLKDETGKDHQSDKVETARRLPATQDSGKSREPRTQRRRHHDSGNNLKRRQNENNETAGELLDRIERISLRRQSKMEIGHEILPRGWEDGP